MSANVHGVVSSSKVAKYAVVWFTAAGVAYWVYWNLYGRPSSRKRKDLERLLEQAQHTVRDLEDKLLSLEQDEQKEGRKEIRIWMDGAFDMMHYGHMNAFRQARALGTYLIAGVNSDETITQCKGKPICSEAERLETVRGCKWVDEVVEGVPYVLDEQTLLHYIEKYKIDYVVHGDDPCIVNGRNVYESAIKLGKYLTIPRTEGISTTDIVGRMLLMTTSHHTPSPATPHVPKSHFLTTSRILRLFGAAGASADGRNPSNSNSNSNSSGERRVVYVGGGWDMFHAGHVEVLRRARDFGDYVVVGVYGDQVVNERRGGNFPIFSLHERVLSVLGCKYVDEVLIDAAPRITSEMMASLRIHTVLLPLPRDTNATATAEQPSPSALEEFVREGGDLEVPHAQHKLSVVYVSHALSPMTFVERVQAHRDTLRERFARKMAAEQDFYKQKYHI